MMSSALVREAGRVGLAVALGALAATYLGPAGTEPSGPPGIHLDRDRLLAEGEALLRSRCERLAELESGVRQRQIELHVARTASPDRTDVVYRIVRILRRDRAELETVRREVGELRNIVERLRAIPDDESLEANEVLREFRARGRVYLRWNELFPSRSERPSEDWPGGR